ncbi:prion-inhibition and propagation-domain-containing protein [Pseudomassariella vexata]|uniref:Prion-inhibition and propagation-domain-containing protein n=1 Tax=Pseudomassariella vexata TaxID=1141098 RepID=A0A1Y2DJ67_9PEZI|nr:prion-inhibition and propagation-domain-containing protein [Pseudomassariella vexata]ORY59249.1 prion-inhibition and propagation-domain-containing protein [Pseudomassariella vexata]
MDPVSAAGLALSVASIGLQVYTGCIQGIQLLVTAKNFPEECKYLNLRLRMEQQRLFAWSETSGLQELDDKNQQKILESNTFVLHRTTVLDLLVQIQCLFKEFRDQQKQYKRLQVVNGPDDAMQNPEQDASDANFPLPQKRRDFIKKAMGSLRERTKEGALRLKWASFDKEGFEKLLARFATLNDNMTDILDARLQVEIHRTVQDTNRGMLQLHRKIADLSRLVMALNIKMDASPQYASVPMSDTQKQARAADASGLKLVSQLAKFKAFNEAIESDRQSPLDEATAMCLELGKLGQRKDLMLDVAMIQIKPSAERIESQRCDAVLECPNGSRKQIWIEWKEYARETPNDVVPPKQVILERVWKLVALLNHSPKPEAFRTPHCLGFFDQASANGEDSDDDDISNLRLGLVFERPGDNSLHTDMPPVSLRQLFEKDPRTYRKPSVSERIKLAHAVSNCLLSLHLANWLHKSLRSENLIFFSTAGGHIDYSKPYLSGFDFSRPARKDEMTEVAGDNVDHNLYRHPHAQTTTSSGERERFKKSFDIYSLGVLFVEIAHWVTVDKVLRIDLNKARGRPSIVARVQENLLMPDMLDELGGHMGDVYQEAARRCIAGGKWLNLVEMDDETNNEVAARLSLTFYEKVVKQLANIVI